MKLPQSIFPAVFSGLASLSLLVTPPVFADSNTACKTPVDVNKADVHCLTLVHGIGEKMADRIVQYREANGDFKSLEDLVAVKGISDKKLNKWKDELTVSGVKAVD